jgi:beta-carotene 15,15'-dioxygenase
MLASRQNIYFGIITLLVLVPYQMGWALPLGFDTWVLIFSLSVTGIPHGAIDHVIFLQNQKGNTTKGNLLKSFFMPYLLLIGLTFLLWLLIPEIMFWFFLAVAAYHFGQSQLYYIHLPEKSKSKTVLYISWGIFILSSLWIFHWEQQSTIIQSVFSWNLDANGILYQSIFLAAVLSGVITIAVLISLFRKGLLAGKMLVQEILVLMLLTALFMYTTPFMAFAVYFGLWHAARVMITEYHFLKMEKKNQLSLVSFIKSFLPFSLLSFAGLGMLYWISKLLEASISPFMLFLIFISALTMPHAYFMERMYKFLGNPINKPEIATVSIDHSG